MMELAKLQQFIFIWSIPLVFAITMHEMAHGWVANKLGDPTAKMLGRVTLNPVKHIDPLGTLLVPALMYWFSGFIFGWAKPVPVTYENLRHKRRDPALVALAGPGANLLMAAIWALVVKLALFLGNPMLAQMGVVGIFINLILMVLNLIPLPPLDGSRVLGSLVGGKLEYFFWRIEPYGLFILLFLLVTGILFFVIRPIFIFFLFSIVTLFDLPSDVLALI